MNEDDGAIYAPPKAGLPYLVVTVDGDGLSARPVGSRVEARTLLSKERLLRARARDNGRESLERATKAP